MTCEHGENHEPNEETLEALRDAENGSNLTYSSLEEFRASLGLDVAKADSDESFAIVFVRNEEGQFVPAMPLTREQSLQIAEALLNPPAPNEALQRAAKKKYDMILSESE